MVETHKSQAERLIESVNDFSKRNGEAISIEVESNSLLLLQWMQYLCTYKLTGVADGLLTAVGPSLREVAATLSMGLIRPALFSLRSQIDLVLTWLYFKDHPVEWEYVNDTGEGFKMKKDLITYLTTYNPSFGLRFGILKSISKRKVEEPYRFLSAHIHGQSIAVLSDISNFDDLVRPLEELKGCVVAVYEVCEYLNDILLALYADNWSALPENIRKSLEIRFVTLDQKSNFFLANKPNK